MALDLERDGFPEVELLQNLIWKNGWFFSWSTCFMVIWKNMFSIDVVFNLIWKKLIFHKQMVFLNFITMVPLASRAMLAA